MDPVTGINLGLTLLGQVINFINQIKGQNGVEDDVILAQAEKITAGNDAAYNQLVAALTGSVVAAPAK